MSRSTLAPFTYVPAKLGLDGVTLASERTSNSFDMRYRNKVTVSVKGTRTDYTALLVKYQHSPDQGTNWFDIQSESIAAGTGTLSDYVPTKTVSASDLFVTSLIDCKYKDMRIKVSGTAGSANDTVSVWVDVE